MSAQSLDGHGASTSTKSHTDLVPREYLRAIALWSLIPAYLFAGGLLGYLADRALDSFPLGVGLGLLIALVLSVRDMLRLRDELGLSPNKG